MHDLTRSTRDRNKLKIFTLILKHGEISRSELSRISELTRPTVSAVMRDLVAMGWVRKVGKGKSSGGKRPMMYEVCPDALYVIGFDVADEFLIRGVLCDFSGNIRAESEYEYENDFDSIIQLLARMTTELAGDTPFDKIQGIGIAVAGIVDSKINEVTDCFHLNLASKGMAGKLTDLTGLPVMLENRPNAAVLAEHQDSGKDMVYLTCGRGVGAGIISEGKLFRGSFGAAGEMGRILLPGRANDVIGVDTASTLESQTRLSKVLDEVRSVKNAEIQYDDVIQMYLEGDTEVEKIMNRNAEYLAYGAFIVANIVNPEIIVIGGKAGELGDKYLNHLIDSFRQFPCNRHQQRTRIRFASLGKFQPALGGAVMVLQNTIAEMAVDAS